VSTTGSELHALIAELFPICRSISGEGLRESLRIVGRYVPLELHEVATGTEVLDWTVPKEWNIRDAYVADATGRRLIDFQASNLHVVNYSVPFRGRLTLEQLRPHLHSLPDQPGLVPYRTTYFEQTWGFCLAHEQLVALEEGDYEVCVDSTLEPGSITYGEAVLRGATENEVVVAIHACHPSLANDNLSGVAVGAFLARELAGRRRKLTYRFVFHPGTIGAIAWLAENQSKLDRVRHGLVLTCLGDAGSITYKRSRRGDVSVDRAAAHVLGRGGDAFTIEDFAPWGYAERQFCSPGFDLPVGCLMRTPHGRFPEYHTSADNLSFVTAEALEDSLQKALSILEMLDADARYANTKPFGEPQLSKAGIDRAIAGHADPASFQLAVLWVLNQSDGRTTLLEVAERSGMPFALLREAADVLLAHGLLA
jgi:aminopeptidase-like protein